MAASAQAVQHIGETKGIADHDHDMVHELNKRLDALWRYDQYIANAEGQSSVKTFWKKLKEQDTQNVEELRRLIAEHVKKDCF
jgi:hypothetical protein